MFAVTATFVVVIANRVDTAKNTGTTHGAGTVMKLWDYFLNGLSILFMKLLGWGLPPRHRTRTEREKNAEVEDVERFDHNRIHENNYDVYSQHCAGGAC